MISENGDYIEELVGGDKSGPSGTILIVPTKKNKLKHFSKWSGVNGIEQFIERETGCKPFSGAGINPRISHKTTILKSIDNTYYYDDNLNNEDQIKYTLFGHSGDQDDKEPRFNEPLLNPEKTKHIYVYRVKQEGKKKQWIWYGKYKILGKETKRHSGKDHHMRNIVILELKKI